jgi:hypothetical protein
MPGRRVGAVRAVPNEPIRPSLPSACLLLINPVSVPFMACSVRRWTAGRPR